LATVVGPASLYPIYAAAVVEAMTDVLPDVDGRIRFDEPALRRVIEGKSAVVIGPGIGVDDDTRKVVAWVVRQSRVPVVLDADALNCVAGHTELLTAAAAPLLLTPHPGEMARLTGMSTKAIQADRVGCARRFAERHGCILILKGARTVIADPQGRAWINPAGNPGMASGGMGDVLCGILGGFLAQGLPPGEAARLGVYLHGASADRVAEDSGEIGMLASDIIAALPRALARLRQGRDG
jgi:NAD(P)H-hydrate epimerase